LAILWVGRIVSRVVISREPFDTADALLNELDNIQQHLQAFSEPGLNKFSVVHAAHRLNIPVSKFTTDVHQLGTGQYARWMDSTVTDRTPAIAIAMARNKFVTANVLRAAGLPGPTHQFVHSIESALQVAHQIGFPVVVKPADLDLGLGVAADLRDEASVTAAYTEASRHSTNVLVEKWFDGFTHRLTVIEGQVIRVSKRTAGGVVGDGESSIEALVENVQTQETYRRRVRRSGKPLLNLDEEAIGLLVQNGLSPSHIPVAGEYIRLRRRDNVNAGGLSEVCPLSTIHPDNLRLAIDATRLMRLDFAGIDLLIKDIEKSWLDIGALICEVNAKPQVVAPEQPRIYEDILSRMFPLGARVPAHLVAYPEKSDQDEALILHWTEKLNCNAISSQSGLWINGARATGTFQNGLYAARALLSRPDINSVVCLMTLQEIVKYGLPCNQWDSVHFSEVASHEEQDFRLQNIARHMLRTDI
jgi:cyanophycin synthetase